MGWFDNEANTCSECTYLVPSKTNSDGLYYCEKKYEYVSACAIACDGFCKAYSRSYEEAKSLRENSSSNSSSGPCYITTIVCNILGKEDNAKCLQILRNFRDNVLQKADKYKPILATYDIVGPIIADKIENDPSKEQIAFSTFTHGIKKVCELLEEKKEEDAISLYMYMTDLLIQRYDIKETYDSEYLKNMDMEKSGHGKVAVLKTKTN